jgi:hypothetical protein
VDYYHIREYNSVKLGDFAATSEAALDQIVKAKWDLFAQIFSSLVFSLLALFMMILFGAVLHFA